MKKRNGSLCVACLGAFSAVFAGCCCAGQENEFLFMFCAAVYLHLAKEPPALTLQRSEVQSAL